MPGVIVPRKTVNELYRLLDDAQQDVDIEVSTEKIRFTIGSMVITSKLISGTFPDYSRVIPDGNDKTLAVDTELFRHAAERVSTLSQDKGRAIKFTIGQDSLQLSVNSPENGHAEEEIAATYSGTPMEIGFSSRYIADIMAQLKNPMMKILLSDPGSPIIVRDGDNEASLYVLMPMRV
jgi:DNA polymerase-3 subunit beta